MDYLSFSHYYLFSLHHLRHTAALFLLHVARAAFWTLSHLCALHYHAISPPFTLRFILRLIYTRTCLRIRGLHVLGTTYSRRRISAADVLVGLHIGSLTAPYTACTRSTHTLCRCLSIGLHSVCYGFSWHSTLWISRFLSWFTSFSGLSVSTSTLHGLCLRLGFFYTCSLFHYTSSRSLFSAIPPLTTFLSAAHYTSLSACSLFSSSTALLLLHTNTLYLYILFSLLYSLHTAFAAYQGLDALWDTLLCYYPSG